MTLREALRAIPSHRPIIWGGVLAWMLLQLIGHLFSNQNGIVLHRDPLLGLFWGCVSAMDPIIYVLLSPFAWRWTGDDRPMASVARGISVSLAISLLGGLILKTPWLLWMELHQGQALHFPLSALFNPSMILFLLIGLFAGYGITWNEHQASQQQQALASMREAKWTLLRSQLSPHLVLNALNGLAGLVEENPKRAAQGLEDLAEIYAQISTLGESETLPLGRERALLQRYLSVEQLRLEEKLRVFWDWDESLDSVEVPPLLLQPLVENALKHGISPHPGGGELRIHCGRMGAHLHLEVSNTGCPLGVKAPVEGSGIGLRNLRKRLELVFGDQSILDLRQDGAWTRAVLMLPIPIP